MTLEKLESRIRKTSETELDKIREDGRKRVLLIDSDIKAESERESSKIAEEGKREIQWTAEGILSSARIEAREIVEAKKREMLDEVFAQARERITALPDKEKKTLLQRMLAKASEGIDRPKVFVDTSCKKLLHGKEANLGDFGFVVADHEETIRIDCTLGNLLSRLKPAVEPEIVSLLFKPQK